MEGYEGWGTEENDVEVIALRNQKAQIDHKKNAETRKQKLAAEKKLLRMQIIEDGETPVA